MMNKFYWHGEGKQGGPEPSIEAVKKHLTEYERKGNYRAVRMLNDKPLSVEDIVL